MPAVLAIVTMAVAASLFTLVAAPLQRQAAGLAQHRAQLAVQAPEAAMQRPATEQLSGLPTSRQRGKDLEALVAELQRSGLQLDKADYSTTEVDASGASRLEANLPLTGSYAELRRFIAATLDRHPHVALESLQLERSDTRSQQLQVTAKLVFFYREGAP
jgi:Tfp pilus assembly protein PilO